MSHINESCLIWMSHVSFEWVMSHMNESCLIWMSHVSYECVMPHMTESWLIAVAARGPSRRGWDMSFMNVSCPIWVVVSQINGSCLVWMSHVPLLWQRGACGRGLSHVTDKWGMSHINESCHIQVSHITYKWMISCHIWFTHVSCEWGMSHCCGSAWPCERGMSHVTYKWSMSCHIWITQWEGEQVLSQMNEWCVSAGPCGGQTFQPTLLHIYIFKCIYPYKYMYIIYVYRHIYIYILRNVHTARGLAAAEDSS